MKPPSSVQPRSWPLNPNPREYSLMFDPNTVSETIDAQVPGVFKYSTHNGNVNVQFNSLKGTSDEEKCRNLVRAADALRSVGLDPTVRLTTNFGNRQNPDWKAFPHIWVNQPTAVEEVATNAQTRVEALEAQVQQLIAALTAQGGGATPTPEAPATTEATETPF